MQSSLVEQVSRTISSYNKRFWSTRSGVELRIRLPSISCPAPVCLSTSFSFHYVSLRDFVPLRDVDILAGSTPPEKAFWALSLQASYT